MSKLYFSMLSYGPVIIHVLDNAGSSIEIRAPSLWIAAVNLFYFNETFEVYVDERWRRLYFRPDLRDLV